MAEWVPVRAVLALLLQVADERTGCVPTWVVLTCGCREGVEVDVHDAPDEVKARASCERGSHGRSFDRDTMERAQGRLNLESWRRRWCSVELRAWDRSANVTTTGTAETESGIRVLGMGKWGD